MENNTQEIGAYLKAQRENRKVSIEEVAYKTKINLNVLKHLEANELNHLPNKTYVRGFVKNYCKVLGIDENSALDILDQTYGVKVTAKMEELADAQNQTFEKSFNPTSKTAEVDEREELNDKMILMIKSLFNKKVLIIVSSFAVAALIINAIVNFFTTLSNEQIKLAQDKQIETPVVATTTVAENPPLIVQDETIKDINANLFESKKLSDLQQSTLAITKEEKPKEEKKETVALPSGKFPFVKFSQAPDKTYSTDPNASENTNEEIFPTRYRQSMDPTKANVYIHATNDDTWISYQVDDEEIKRYVLKKGRSVFLKGEVILLFMGNVNSTNIFYNNELVTADSKTGVKSFIFPNSQSANYELPLFPAYKGVPYKAKDYKANMMKE